MAYVWQNLIVDNIWVLGVILGIVMLMIVVDAVQRGINNLSPTEGVFFFISLAGLLLLYILG